MTQSTSKPQGAQEVGDALANIAAHSEHGSDWEVFHDPATGQMKFVRRGDSPGHPLPGTVPVTSIAATGFAAIA